MYSAMRCASCAVQVSRVYWSATDGNKFILSIIFYELCTFDYQSRAYSFNLTAKCMLNCKTSSKESLAFYLAYVFPSEVLAGVIAGFIAALCRQF